NWVLQVDGHTDDKPINSALYPSNWELSSARAIAVVKFLHEQGIPYNRLVAAGYGEFQPLSTTDINRNRRIELKLTNR
ncbi:MAG: OmpA family protein, partial [Alphaproteobacteria bacterium]|nr:OmpA family protein [Alphaproteobacteria bacterium]